MIRGARPADPLDRTFDGNDFFRPENLLPGPAGTSAADGLWANSRSCQGFGEDLSPYWATCHAVVM